MFKTALLAFGISLIGSAPILLAQADRGTISGTVSDPTGAVVPNAKITVYPLKIENGEVMIEI